MENTIELFRQDVYQKTATAKIICFEETDKGFCVILDQTIFFPEGGGQGCDLGTIDGHPLCYVETKDGIIRHYFGKEPVGLVLGADVTLELDWQNRFDNMQRHCGEHIMSGIFHREYGGINRGFHMGEDYMTIDISLEDNPAYDSVTWEMAKHVELCTNMVIWDNSPVTTFFFKDKADALDMPLRKKLTIEKNITIVCVGDPSDPSDCVACCGTHPSTAGQVGMVKIFKVESNKGMWRIYFEAGQRAFKKIQEYYDTLTILGRRLSAGPEDLLHKFEAHETKFKEIKGQAYTMSNLLMEQEVTSLLSMDTSQVQIKTYDDLSLDQILAIGRKVSPSVDRLFMLVHNKSHTVLLFSNGKIDCGKLVKENAGIYNGKGGGNATSARAIFTKADYCITFTDLIEKHLR